MKLKNIYIIILILSISSCTKIIDVDLNESGKKLVIDARISRLSDNSFEFSISSSETQSYFNEDNYPNRIYLDSITLKNGSDKVIQENNIDSIKRIISNTYKNNEFHLKINYLNEEINALAFIPSFVEIDSIKLEVPFFTIPGTEPKLVPHVYFTDNPNEDNYYKIRAYTKGEKPKFSEFFIPDDGQNGKVIKMPIRFKMPEKNILFIELYSMDKFTYDYFRVLNMNSGAGGSNAPGNPETNIEGNAIGIFAAYSLSKTYLTPKSNDSI